MVCTEVPRYIVAQLIEFRDTVASGFFFPAAKKRPQSRLIEVKWCGFYCCRVAVRSSHSHSPFQTFWLYTSLLLFPHQAIIAFVPDNNKSLWGLCFLVMAVYWWFCAHVSGQLSLLLHVMGLMTSNDMEPQQHRIYRGFWNRETWPYGDTTGLTTAGEIELF